MTTAVSSLLVLGLAVVIDLIFGEPPTALHPVAWMGWVVNLVRKYAPRGGRWKPFATGLLLMLLGVSFVAGLGWVIVWLLRQAPLPVAILVEAVLLKCTLSIRALASAGRQVQSALASGDLGEARRLLSWHLVSRDTQSLGVSHVAAATIESLAENTSDSIVAPLLFYACVGLPGALAYRFINMCDAMLGYRDAEREWLGKAPARLDDLANLLPARVTAAIIIAAAPLMGGNGWRASMVWRLDRRLTASPNAGQPMSAAAGALGVQLEKVNYYCLGRGLALPGPADIGRAARLLLVTAGLACVAAGLLIVTLSMIHDHFATP